MSVLSEAVRVDIIVMRIQNASINLVHLSANAWMALVVSINGIVLKLMNAKRTNIRVMRMQFAQIPSARTGMTQ